MTAAIQAINGNIMFGENIPGQEIRLQFVYSALSDFPKNVSWKLPEGLKPVEMRLCSATEDGIPIGIIAPWSFANQTISFSALYKVTPTGIAPLTKGASYNIVFRGQP